MIKHARGWILAGTAALLLVGLAVARDLARQQEDRHQLQATELRPLPGGPWSALELTAPGTRIELTATSSPRLVVAAERRAHGPSGATAQARLDAIRWEAVSSGSTLVLRRLDTPSGGPRWWRALWSLPPAPPDLTWQVAVPAASSLSVQVRGTTGPVTLREIQGTLRVITESGAVELVRCRGRANVKTGSGEQRVTDFQGEALVLYATEGPVSLDQARGAIASASLMTGRGDIMATLSVPARLTVDALSGAGAVVNRLAPLPRGVEPDSQALHLVLGDGRDSLRARSRFGVILLEAATASR